MHVKIPFVLCFSYIFKDSKFRFEKLSIVFLLHLHSSCALVQLSGMAKMFSSEMTLASAWIHLLAVDLFAARSLSLSLWFCVRCVHSITCIGRLTFGISSFNQAGFS